MPRLFTGLEIPAEIGQTLSNLRGGLPGARWIDPENYHVTLRFIGDIDGVAANEIASMLFRVNRKPFEVTLQGLSSFGGKKPRAVVASVVPSRPLIELQAELERLMQRIGLDPEGRKFTPHVTLARLRDASNQDVADYLSVRGYFPTRVFMADALRAVLLARLHRRRALCGRGFLRAERVRRRAPDAARPSAGRRTYAGAVADRHEPPATHASVKTPGDASKRMRPCTNSRLAISARLGP